VLVRIIVGLIAVLIALSVLGAILRTLRSFLWIGLGVALLLAIFASIGNSKRDT
jgi:hypothetical protein